MNFPANNPNHSIKSLHIDVHIFYPTKGNSENKQFPKLYKLFHHQQKYFFLFHKNHHNMHTLNQRFPYQEMPTECNTHTHTHSDTDGRPHKYTHILTPMHCGMRQFVALIFRHGKLQQAAFLSRIACNNKYACVQCLCSYSVYTT